MKVQDSLNARLIDTVTGFTGICIGYAIYATGCHQACIVPRVDKDGKRAEGEWFDIERLIPAAVQPDKSVKTSPGGGPRHRSEEPPTR